MPIVINVATQADLGVFKDLVKALGQAKQATQGFTQSTTPYTGGSGRGAKPPQIAPTQIDVYRYLDAVNRATKGGFQAQRDDALIRAFSGAQQRYTSTGDPAALRQMTALSGQVARLGQGASGFGPALRRAIMSTRFGLGGGGGVQPLVGQVMNVLGKSGPIGVAVAAGAAVIMSFVAVVKSAGDQIKAFTGQMLEANTSATSMQALNRIGSLLGGDMAGRARQFRETIASNGIAMDAAMRAGINPIKDPFGRTDYGADFLKALKQIAFASSEAEARRLAQLYGQPDMARAYYLSDSTKRYMLNQGEKAPSRASMQAAEEFTFWLEDFKRVGMEFVREVGAPLLSGLSKVTRFLVGLAQGLKSIGEFIANSPILSAIVYGLIGAIGGGDGKKVQTALDRNTAAINANTRALGDQRGIYGGGQRAQRALPSRVKGLYLNDRVYRQGLSTGLL